MVLDTSRLAHTARRNDDLRAHVLVYRAGVVARQRADKPFKRDWIYAAAHEGESLFVVAALAVVDENVGRLVGEGAVDVHGEVVVSRDEPVVLYLAQEVEHLLRSADRKRRNNNASAAVKGGLEHLGQRGDVVGGAVVDAVAVGGLHNDVVGGVDVLRIADERLVNIADIARKDDSTRLAVLSHGEDDACRAEEVSRVAETNRDALGYLGVGLILVRHEQLYRSDSVVHGVERLVVVLAAALSLSAAPFGFKFLYVRTVAQHDAAQVGSGGGGVDRSAESARIEQGEQSRVVDVGVREEHEVDIGGSYGNLDVLEDVLALFHSEIDKEFPAASLDICAAARDLVGSADECHFHR